MCFLRECWLTRSTDRVCGKDWQVVSRRRGKSTYSFYCRAKVDKIFLPSQKHCTKNSSKLQSMGMPPPHSAEPALHMNPQMDDFRVDQTAIQFGLHPLENASLGPPSQPPEALSLPSYMTLHTSTPRVPSLSSYASEPYTSMSAPRPYRSTFPSDPLTSTSYLPTSDTSAPYPDPLALISSTPYAPALNTSPSVPQPSTSYMSLSDTSVVHPSTSYASASTSDNVALQPSTSYYAPYDEYNVNDTDQTG